MWTCPECKRSFRNKNQWHSCKVYSLDEFLKKKPQNLLNLFVKIDNQIRDFGEVKVEVLQTQIQYRSGAAFLSIMFKKNFLILEFALDSHYEKFPVYETVQISTRRTYHKASIYDEEDITDDFLSTLRKACEIIKSEKY